MTAVNQRSIITLMNAATQHPPTAYDAFVRASKVNGYSADFTLRMIVKAFPDDARAELAKFVTAGYAALKLSDAAALERAAEEPTTRVVRSDIYGGAKFHIKTGERSSACGAEPRTVGIWANSGSRADFERLCPERICKRCVKAVA